MLSVLLLTAVKSALSVCVVLPSAIEAHSLTQGLPVAREKVQGQEKRYPSANINNHSIVPRLPRYGV